MIMMFCQWVEKTVFVGKNSFCRDGKTVFFTQWQKLANPAFS